MHSFGVLSQDTPPADTNSTSFVTPSPVSVTEKAVLKAPTKKVGCGFYMRMLSYTLIGQDRDQYRIYLVR